MARLEIEHRESRRFPWWIPALIGGLILGAILGAVVTRTVTAADLDADNLQQVLEYGSLPRSFVYGGLRWQAVDSGRFGRRLELIRIGPTVADHPIYYERGTPTDPYRTLYLPAAQTGPNADVFARYRPVGPATG
ncbi:MAG: hypothetical protein HY321_10115 [Armatimonadetes bacterium]|nr:hypothetical protein [Armatimonadota bacterium]